MCYDPLMYIYVCLLQGHNMKGIPNMKKSELKAIIRECLDEALTPIEKEQGLLRRMSKQARGIKARRTMKRVAADKPFAVTNKDGSQSYAPTTNYQNLKTIRKVHNKSSKTRGVKPKGGY